MSDNDYHTLLAKLDREIGPQFDAEVSAIASCRSINLLARFDFIRGDTLYEVKCVSEIILEHILQLILYAYVVQNNAKYKDIVRKFVLINLTTDERYTIDNPDAEIITDITEKIVLARFGANRADDVEFIHRHSVQICE